MFDLDKVYPLYFLVKHLGIGHFEATYTFFLQRSPPLESPYLPRASSLKKLPIIYLFYSFHLGQHPPPPFSKHIYVSNIPFSM